MSKIGMNERTTVYSGLASAGLLVAAIVGAPVAEAALYTGATISIIQTPTPSANCVYFQLAGVTQADPVAPNNAWFAVPSTQNGYSQIYATLLSIKIAGGTVGVLTSGSLAGGSCGSYAGIDHLNI